MASQRPWTGMTIPATETGKTAAARKNVERITISSFRPPTPLMPATHHARGPLPHIVTFSQLRPAGRLALRQIQRCPLCPGRPPQGMNGSTQSASDLPGMHRRTVATASALDLPSASR
jgi:hypothetical protein